MMNNAQNGFITKKVNNIWQGNVHPFFSVITPVYNRLETIRRTIESVKSQTFKDFEYIIVDDGSIPTQSIDDIICDFMKNVSFPVMYLKKENGGVHTARNLSYEYARGKMVVCIDSDDELLPQCLEIFHDAWETVPENERSLYWQIKAQCVDQNGKITGTLFPSEINTMPLTQRKKSFSLAKGEQIGCRLTKILKENRFPEPEGVKFVGENLLWVRLENKYLSWGLNEPVCIYYTGREDGLCNNRKVKSIQNCKDAMWNAMYELNNYKVYSCRGKRYIATMLRYSIMRHIIRRHETSFCHGNRLYGAKNRLWELLFWLPTYFGAKIYKKKRMK